MSHHMSCDCVTIKSDSQYVKIRYENPTETESLEFLYERRRKVDFREIRQSGQQITSRSIT